MSATQDLESYARSMLAGFARLLLRAPVGDLPDALRTLADASGTAHAAAAPRGRPAGRASAPAAAPRARARRPGEKRSPQALVQLTEALRRHIEQAPGSRMEAIAKALGTSSTELGLPIHKLLDRGAIRKEGQRRATQYYPGNGASAAEGAKDTSADEGAAPKRAAAKKAGARKGAKRGRRKG
jgi:hypothetical protein